MKHLVTALFSMILLVSQNAQAVGPGSAIVFDGKGAGEVIFDGTVHKGLACADCHEPRGLTPALFEMKRGESWISMKKMERGRSCGFCHEIAQNFSNCSFCHKK